MRFLHLHHEARASGDGRGGRKGFTLFEMLVSIGIFTLITSVLLVKNSQFKGNILITNLAYQIATAVRQAQSYGVNVRGGATGSPRGNPFSYTWPYGVHFAATNLPSGGVILPNSFDLFADKGAADGLYSAAIDGAPIETFRLQQSNTILKFCWKTSLSPSVDYVCSDTTPVSYLGITFKRPDPAANIYIGLGSPAVGVTKTSATSVKIIVSSSKAVCKGVQVDSSGQVSVLDPISCSYNGQ